MLKVWLSAYGYFRRGWDLGEVWLVERSEITWGGVPWKEPLGPQKFLFFMLSRLCELPCPTEAPSVFCLISPKATVPGDC